MKKHLSLLLSILISQSICFGLEVSIPQSNADEVYNGSSSVSAESSSWLTIMDLITKYLWIAMIVVSMIALAWGGFLLIISRGEEAEFKKANKILIYAVIGIIISLLAYVITNVIVNLF